MSHFAEINNDNRVIRVLVGDNNDPMGDEGHQWLINNLGGTWIKTSYNGNIRFNFAGVGDIYDLEADAFYKTQPYPSWSLDSNYQWQPPIPMPDKIKTWKWDEEKLEWQLLEN